MLSIEAQTFYIKEPRCVLNHHKHPLNLPLSASDANLAVPTMVPNDTGDANPKTTPITIYTRPDSTDSLSKQAGCNAMLAVLIISITYSLAKVLKKLQTSSWPEGRTYQRRPMPPFLVNAWICWYCESNTDPVSEHSTKKLKFLPTF